MSVSYSTIKSVSEPEAMAALIAERVIGPVLPSVQVRKVRTRQGRRFEAPRVLWNVYEAELEMPGGLEVRPLFWTKAYFDDKDCADYRKRIDRVLSSQNGNPLDPNGYASYFPDLNLILFFFPSDPIFPRLAKVATPATVQPFLLDHFARTRYRRPGCSRASSVLPSRIAVGAIGGARRRGQRRSTLGDLHVPVRGGRPDDWPHPRVRHRGGAAA